jgi:hypothetical protein
MLGILLVSFRNTERYYGTFSLLGFGVYARRNCTTVCRSSCNTIVQLLDGICNYSLEEKKEYCKAERMSSSTGGRREII